MRVALRLLRAVIFQIVSFSLAVTALFVLQAYFSMTMPLWAFVGIQGISACLISVFYRLEWWWSFIHLLFPPVVALLLAFSISSSIYLGIFFALLVLYFPVLISRVPYFPSNPALLPQLKDLLPVGKPVRLVDIGSGFGGVLFYLEEQRPDCELTGIEFAPFPWLMSWLRARLKKSSVKFKFCKYETVNFHDFDIVFAYLSPAVMSSVWEKVRSEMRPGSLFLSYEFPIPSVTPDLTINLEANEPILYGWRI